ncbi:hypothetical protein HQ576_01320, partial [bacterium]|nr:hypothetical protein [bacterium]
MRHALLVSLLLAAVASAAEVTTVTLTDKVLVKDTVRLGINLGGDAYYSGAALVKRRSVQNFEGTTYRQCHFGPVNGEDGMGTWFGNWADWDEILVGGRFTVLSGPGKGIAGTIKEVTKRPAMHQGKEKQFRYFVFDRKVPVAPHNSGVMVETMRLKDGQFRSLDGYWSSKKNHIAIGDVPPGSFGVAAGCLDATEDGKAHLRFSTHYQR